MLPAAGALAGQATVDTTKEAPKECCASLVMPLGARAVALGRAVVADTAADALPSNPAAIARLGKGMLEIHYRKLPADVQLLGVTFVSRPQRFGTMALSYTLLDEGTIGGTDPFNNPTGSSFSQEHALTATFATRLAKGLTAGLSYKIFLMVSPCGSACDTGGASGATQMVDLGMQYHPAFARWAALGAAVTNAGIPLQVVNFEQSDNPPTRARLGGSFELLHLLQKDSTLTGTLAVQLETGGPPGLVPAIGAEVKVGDVISLRAGWRSAGSQNDNFGGYIDTGLALGVGIKLDRYALSVARAVQTQSLDAVPFQITFGMSF